MRHTIEIDIEWGDCDPARIVFYPNYFYWFDKGTRRLFEAAGLGWATLFDRYRVVGLPLVDASAEFRSPCRFGDRIVLTSAIGECRDRVLTVEHTIHNGERLAVRGREVRAWTIEHPEDPSRLKAVLIPEEIRHRLGADRSEPD